VGAPFAFIGSFSPPSGVNELLGIAVEMEIVAGDELPNWWRLDSDGGACRAGLTTQFVFSDTSCLDFYGGQALGGFYIKSGYRGPDRAQLRIQAAIPYDARTPVDPNKEYYAFRALLARDKSSGTGACAGCNESACLVLKSIQLYQPQEIGLDPIIDVPIDRNWITWQGAGKRCCPLGNVQHAPAWGRVQTLYR